MNKFEKKIQDDLHGYLLSQGKVEERLPDAPDIEEQWEAIAQAYLPDGIREFADYPAVSLGWIMYTGMAVAKLWDEDWQKALDMDNIYLQLRDKRGYDQMDEYIREEVLQLEGDDYAALERLVGECAARTFSQIRHSGAEEGTREAFVVYVNCLHQLYLMGAAIQLLAMGYHMTKM